MSAPSSGPIAAILTDVDGTLFPFGKAPAVAALQTFTHGGKAAAEGGGGRICIFAATRWPEAGPKYGSLRYVELSPDEGESWVTRLIRSAGEPECVLVPDLRALLDDSVAAREDAPSRVLKFCLWTSPGEEGWCDMSLVVRALRSALAGSGARVLDCGARQCEILPAGCHKGSGLHALCKALDVQSEQVLALGDAENDVEMLRAAGVGVCMGNGKPAALEAADAVVGSNDEDGVAEAVRRFAFGEPS